MSIKTIIFICILILFANFIFAHNKFDYSIIQKKNNMMYLKESASDVILKNGPNKENLYNWQCELIWPFYYDADAYFASLALDSNDYPHIVYSIEDPFGYGYEGIEHDWKSPTGWQPKLIDSAGLHFYPSVALDKFNYVHICYKDDDLLKYAYWYGDTLEIEVIDDSCGSCHIVVDSMCHPHISYRAEQYLKYAVKSDSLWHISIVDTGGGIGINNAICLDHEGYPNIVYIKYYAMELWYSFYDGDVWQRDLIAQWPPYYPNSVSLCIDSLDCRRVSFINGQGSPDGHLMYAYQTPPSQWHIDTVDTNHNGASTSIALDKTGNPCIAYYWDNGGYYWLRLATKRGLEWNIEPVETLYWDNAIYNDNKLVLTFDCNNEPHIAYTIGMCRTAYAHGYRLGIIEHTISICSQNLLVSPNPFNQYTHIMFNLLTSSHTIIRIYDSTGRIIRILENRRMDQGRYTVRWDRRDKDGKKVQPGIYFCCIQSGSVNAMAKLIVIN